MIERFVRGTLRAERGGEGGFTLTEVLAAMIILGVAISAVVAAMGSSIIAADVHRKLVTDDAIVRSYAERLNLAPYVDCAAATNIGYSAAGVNLNMGNWPGYVASVKTVEYWNGAEPAGFVPACGADTGLQRITLEVRSEKGRGGNQTLQILKRRR